MAGQDVLLKVENITKRFGGIVAVDHVSLEVKRGEIISIIGPNGAGKTTVFNMLTGVYEVDEGTIIFRGKEIQNQKPGSIVAAGISRTFQNIRLFSDLRVIENVLIGAHIRTNYHFFQSIFRTKKFRKEEDKVTEEAIRLLKSIDLDHRRDEYASNLPYGEQRKLEIARALATDPKLLLLDEPAAGMNPNETGSLMEMIQLVREKFHMTILLIEHDMKLVSGICEKLTVLNFGEVLAQGKTTDVLNDPQVIAAYLGE